MNNHMHVHLVRTFWLIVTHVPGFHASSGVSYSGTVKSFPSRVYMVKPRDQGIFTCRKSLDLHTVPLATVCGRLQGQCYMSIPSLRLESRQQLA